MEVMPPFLLAVKDGISLEAMQGNQASSCT